MSNQLHVPRILVCPSDTTKTAAVEWSSFNPAANATYQYMAPGTKDNNPQAVLFRCPIHGNLGLGNGSVVQEK